MSPRETVAVFKNNILGNYFSIKLGENYVHVTKIYSTLVERNCIASLFKKGADFKIKISKDSRIPH